MTDIEPAIVWMVHRETPRSGVRGRLSLEPAHLVFRPEVGPATSVDALGQTLIALADVSKASKTPGSPVLEVHSSTPGLPGVIMFFFAKPPTPRGSVHPRAYGAGILGVSNTFVGPDVAAWAQTIRAAIAR